MIGNVSRLGVRFYDAAGNLLRRITGAGGFIIPPGTYKNGTVAFIKRSDSDPTKNSAAYYRLAADSAPAMVRVFDLTDGPNGPMIGELAAVREAKRAEQTGNVVYTFPGTIDLPGVGDVGVPVRVSVDDSVTPNRVTVGNHHGGGWVYGKVRTERVRKTGAAKAKPETDWDA